MSEEANSSNSESFPVAPDSVRVWRGYRLGNIPERKFFDKLGSFFIPGTVQIQTPVGLTAYLPSVLPSNKPVGVPDEIALVFYRYPDAYDEAKETVGGRAYSDLHGVAFDLEKSLSGFPDKFNGVFESKGRYYLFNERVDWQKGFVNVFLGVRSNETEEDFCNTVAGWLGDVQKLGQNGPDGAIASGTPDYVVYWEHWANQSDADRSLIPDLSQKVDTVYNQSIEPFVLDKGLWTPYQGVTVNGGESFNFQFDRPT